MKFLYSIDKNNPVPLSCWHLLTSPEADVRKNSGLEILENNVGDCAHCQLEGVRRTVGAGHDAFEHNRRVSLLETESSNCYEHNTGCNQ